MVLQGIICANRLETNFQGFREIYLLTIVARKEG